MPFSSFESKLVLRWVSWRQQEIIGSVFWSNLTFCSLCWRIGTINMKSYHWEMCINSCHSDGLVFSQTSWLSVFTLFISWECWSSSVLSTLCGAGFSVSFSSLLSWKKFFFNFKKIVLLSIILLADRIFQIGRHCSRAFWLFVSVIESGVTLTGQQSCGLACLLELALPFLHSVPSVFYMIPGEFVVSSCPSGLYTWRSISVFKLGDFLLWFYWHYFLCL